MTLQVTPAPTDEETAAIVAAYRAVTARVVVAPDGDATALPPWRFSGRWWSRPVVARRARPWT